ncbi:hypothetical protein ACGFMM_12775 [Streptomyces sp. NPDC048604]|uniref:hypothetical protein n=1 Tax=Streptomyces sp. NPDC048604 TaxID=3365578 RepID=UPI00371449D4
MSARRLLAGLLAAGALFAAPAPGCAAPGDAVDPIERLGRKTVRSAVQAANTVPQARHAVVNWHSA